MNNPNGTVPLVEVLVGSQAHGLALPESDRDTRSVFAIPTAVLLGMHADSAKRAWQTVEKDGDDSGGYEAARFLELVEKCSPSAVEMLYAPRVRLYPEGAGLLELGRTLVTRKPLINAMIGYAMNSWRKIEERPGKWKAGMLRTLYLGRVIAMYGPTSPYVSLNVHTWEDEVAREIIKARNNELSDGYVWDRAKQLREELDSGEWPNLPEALPPMAIESANTWLCRMRLSQDQRFT